MEFGKKEIHPRIERISYLMTQKSPFFSEFLLRYSYYKSEVYKTMATGIFNGRIVLFWNENFIDKLNDDELEGVLIHEIYHIITLSQKRMGARNPKIWNYVTDAINNEDITNSTINNKRIVLPKDSGIFMRHFNDMGYTGKYVAELVYKFVESVSDKFEVNISSRFTSESTDSEEGEGSSQQSNGSEGEEQEQQNGSSSSDSGDEEESSEENSSAGNKGAKEDNNSDEEKDSGSGGGEEDSDIIKIEVFDNHEPLEESETTELDTEIISNMVKDAQVKGWGTYSGDIKKKVEDIIQPKKVNISQKLKNKLSEHFSSSGKQTSTWKRKNRRGLPLPGKVRTKTKINVFIDNSGSCWNDRIASLFFGQLEEFIKMGYEASVYSFDTRVHLVKENYKRGDYKTLKLVGGGGTAVQPIFNTIKEEKKEKESTIILTDGYFNWNFEDYGIEPLWMLTETGYEKKAPESRRFFLERR